MVLAAFFALPVMGNVAFSDGPDSMTNAGSVEWHAPPPDWGEDDTTQIKDVTYVEDGMVAGIQPGLEAQAVPPGATSFRVEVAGDDDYATMVVLAKADDSLVPGTPLPFAVDVLMEEPGALLSVVARGASGAAELQCRVYADGVLVAVRSGTGSAECLLPR